MPSFSSSHVSFMQIRLWMDAKFLFFSCVFNADTTPVRDIARGEETAGAREFHLFRRVLVLEGNLQCRRICEVLLAFVASGCSC